MAPKQSSSVGVGGGSDVGGPPQAYAAAQPGFVTLPSDVKTMYKQFEALEEIIVCPAKAVPSYCPINGAEASEPLYINI